MKNLLLHDLYIMEKRKEKYKRKKFKKYNFFNKKDSLFFLMFVWYSNVRCFLRTVFYL
jgi:hypothetical protein